MILWNTARMSLNGYSDIRTSKVLEVTLAFWIIKIAATAVGETGGDALPMTLNLGYALSAPVFFAFFIVTVAAQVASNLFTGFYIGLLLSQQPPPGQRWRTMRIARSRSATWAAQFYSSRY